MLPSLLLAAAAAISPAPALAQDSGQEGPLVFKGGAGAGAGIHVVLIAGDEEYRSEEALPMLAKILSVHHGFRCTVLFSTDPETGAIDADNQVHTPHLETLADADLVILALRFREWRDEDVCHSKKTTCFLWLMCVERGSDEMVPSFVIICEHLLSIIFT